MKMPKSYPLVFIVGVGCIALNVLMLRLTPSTHSSVADVARSLINRNGEFERRDFREDMDSDQPYFHLKVPFYIYEDTALYWANATVDGEVYKPPEPQAVGADGKHSDDYWLLQAALNHPMRTLDPEKAKLFFVPTLLNAALQLAAQFWLSKGFFCADSTNKYCFRKDTSYRLFRQVHRHLGRSEYFIRNEGKDHVIVSSHWQSRDLPFRLFHIYQCNSINFENELPEAARKFPRVRIPAFYIGKQCPPIAVENKTHDFAMIATIKNIPTFKTRKNICYWLSEDDPDGNPYSVSHCGKGDQCPALAQAKYGFHARGDTWGSNRLMDTIMSRTVPIFTSEQQYKILPSFFPWREISYVVNVTNRKSFRASLKDIMDRPESEYLEKQRLIEKYMHMLDHRQPYQFDRFMTEFAQRLGFQ